MVASATFVVFMPSLWNGFVTWDDDLNFLKNESYRGLGRKQLVWMWTTFQSGHYAPLTWMSHGLDYTLWGMRPGGYHATNVLLHSLNAGLVYILCRRTLELIDPTTGGDTNASLASAFGALVFAVHPLRVESVVWLTERRDVLSLAFCLVSVLLYLEHWKRRPELWLYGLSLGAFLAGLLSKGTSVIVVPGITALVGYAIYQRDRSVRLVRRFGVEMLPFVAIAGLSSLLTLHALQRVSQLGAGDKVAVSLYSLAFYVWKLFLPIGLSPLYERPSSIPATSAAFALAYLTVALLVGGSLYFGRRHRGVVFVTAAYVLVSFPMLGAVQNGPQLVADRYTYHVGPVIALLGAVVFRAALDRWRRRTVVIASTVVTALSALTIHQTTYWKDGDTLWARILEIEPDSPTGNLGMARQFVARGDYSRSLPFYERAMGGFPWFAEGHNDFGTALANTGHLDSAAHEYERALRLMPTMPEAHSNLALVLARTGDIAAAKAQMAEAIRLDARNAAFQINMGSLLFRSDSLSEAASYYDSALRLEPQNTDAHFNLGVTLVRLGHLAAAREQFEIVLQIDPHRDDARNLLKQIGAHS